MQHPETQDGLAVPRPPRRDLPALAKAATGIDGLDAVTGGGLPRGRCTLVCGPAGCGAGSTPARSTCSARARRSSASRATCSPCRRSSREHEPSVVVLDPMSDLLDDGNGDEVTSFLTRRVDFLEAWGITAVSSESEAQGASQIASLVDVWLLVKPEEGNGEHHRVPYVRKSRGLANSNQIRAFLLTDHGIERADVYVGPPGVLTGSARQAREATERSEGVARIEDLGQRRASLEGRREAVEAQTAALWREFDDEASVVDRVLVHASTGSEEREGQRAEQGRLRRADARGAREPAPSSNGDGGA